MKKILAILAAASLVLTMTACGNSGDAGSLVTQGGAAVDEKGNEIPGTTIDGAGKEVEMKKVDGKTLNSDTSDRLSKGDIGANHVSIDSAKLVETEDSKILVVSFTYENNSTEAAAFSNRFTVNATQNETKMMPAVVNMEGINVLSGVEVIDPGKKTRVQKTYFVTDEETPVTVMVQKYGLPEDGQVEKVFLLK